MNKYDLDIQRMIYNDQGGADYQRKVRIANAKICLLNASKSTGQVAHQYLNRAIENTREALKAAMFIKAEKQCA